MKDVSSLFEKKATGFLDSLGFDSMLFVKNV